MRVLHIIPSISPSRGGPSAALIPMVAALRDQGLDCRVLTTNDDGPLNGALETGRWSTHQGIPVLAFPRKLLGMRWFDEHIVAPQALEWLRQEGMQWDLLHVHAVFSYLSTRSMTWARKNARPYISRPLGQLCEWSLGQKSLRKTAYLRLLEKRNLACASRVHFTSQQERQECQTAGIKVSAMVVPHGVVMPDKLAASNQRKPLSIVFLSRLDPKKGLERLIQGFIQAAASLNGATLTIAGTGDPHYQRQLLALAERSGAASIRFSGWVQGAEKRRLLEQADIFVLPSYSENFGVAVLEALSFGIPVVLTPAVALASQVEEARAGLLIDGSPDSIAGALKQLAADASLRQSLGDAGSAMARQQFSWPSIAKQLQQQYRDVLSPR